MKKKAPTIEYTEFLDDEGMVFSSLPGEGNIQTNGEHDMITRRTTWNDGYVGEETFRYQTWGTPIRGDLELKNELDVLKVS